MLRFGQHAFTFSCSVLNRTARRHSVREVQRMLCHTQTGAKCCSYIDHQTKTTDASSSNIASSVHSAIYPPVCAERDFRISRATIVTKLSRLELEQHRNPDLNAEQLERFIRERGTDYDSLLYHHHIHKNFQTRVADCFTDAGVQVRVTNRHNLTAEQIKWADMLVPIGGDGTFLMAAGRASPLLDAPCHTPIVGFNSDPVRSEGRLMLPKEFSHDPRAAVRKILNGDFKWERRSRIKVTLLGENGDLSSAIDMYENHVSSPPGSDAEPAPEPLTDSERIRYGSKMKKTLPYLALNEVFIGETMAARVSHLHIGKDDELTVTKTKSSGLCVSTGTGSTSWLTSINRLSAMNMRKLLEILELCNVVTKRLDGNVGRVDAEAICEEYNNRLIFAADDPRMCYSIREQICVGVWPNPKGFQSRGFARAMLIKSRCLDASLVIDGSIAYPFNDGAKALLEVHPEDSLLTISISSDEEPNKTETTCA